MTETGEVDDRLLVSRFLARRDEAAFQALYRRHASFLFRFLMRLTGGNAGEAEEGVQETWVRAVASLERFAWRSSLKTWLAGIALMWWRESLRASRPADSPVELVSAAAPIRREIERLDLERALAALPAGYREALVLHDVEGYTHEEIGALLGIDPGTSKSQLSRARRTLRVRLSEGEHERTG